MQKIQAKKVEKKHMYKKAQNLRTGIILATFVAAFITIGFYSEDENKITGANIINEAYCENTFKSSELEGSAISSAANCELVTNYDGDIFYFTDPNDNSEYQIQVSEEGNPARYKLIGQNGNFWFDKEGNNIGDPSVTRSVRETTRSIQVDLNSGVEETTIPNPRLEEQSQLFASMLMKVGLVASKTDTEPSIRENGVFGDILDPSGSNRRLASGGSVIKIDGNDYWVSYDDSTEEFTVMGEDSEIIATYDRRTGEYKGGERDVRPEDWRVSAETIETIVTPDYGDIPSELKSYADEGRTVTCEGDKCYVSLTASKGRAIFDKDGNYIGREGYKGQFSDMFDQFDSLFEFSGVGAYSKYFIEEETLDAWREAVDGAFSSLYLGTEYWVSEMCSLYVDRTQEGIAYVDTRIGLAGIAAHIEATRSEPLEAPLEADLTNEGFPPDDLEHGIVYPKILYTYKITFNVKNGDHDTDPRARSKMRFNVVAKGQRDAYLFSNDIEISKGESFGHAGSSAIIQSSPFFYDKICLQFELVPSSWALDGNELCNVIAPAPYVPTPLDANPTDGGEGLDVPDSPGGSILQI